MVIQVCFFYYYFTENNAFYVIYNVVLCIRALARARARRPRRGHMGTWRRRRDSRANAPANRPRRVQRRRRRRRRRRHRLDRLIFF